MNNWGANHGAISYGHIGADLITLCSILRIPVCMHNVEEDKIFRPASWNAFGMDKEGADFRACKNYGKSIRTKLLNVARKENVFNQTILTRYFQEQTVYMIKTRNMVRLLHLEVLKNIRKK